MSLKMGLLGRKIGMTQVFHEDGSALGVTAVSVGPCVVVGKRTADKHGYSAVQLGFEELPVRLATRPETGYFKKAGVEKPMRHLREVRLEAKDLDKYEVGKVLRAEEIFKVGDVVDVVGHDQGQGLPGRHEDAQDEGRLGRRTARTSSSATAARSAAASRRAACTRASACRASWATSRTPRPTS